MRICLAGPRPRNPRRGLGDDDAFVYAFMALGAFGIVTGLGQQGEARRLPRPGGGRACESRADVSVPAVVDRIPPTAGFVAKFAVILSAVQAGYVGLAVLAVLCTAVSAFFYLRIAVLMRRMTESPPRRPHAFLLGCRPPWWS